MAYHSPFDLYYWFVQTFAGSMEIFLAIVFIFIAFMAGTFRMASSVVAIMFGLFIIIFASFTGNLYILVLVALAWFFGWAIVRFFK